MHPQPVAEGVAQALFAPPGVGADAGGDVHAHRVDLGGQPGRLFGGVALAEQQPAAGAAQRGVQVGEATGQEGAAVGGVEAGGGDRRVGDEQWEHLVGAGAGGVQGGVVVQAQVLGEQDDGDGHGGSDPGPAGSNSRAGQLR